jgi:prepilin-type N-terminal cleavage/methylation domain-containing protein
MNRRFRSAFTLVEMLIVIAIIGILAGMTAVGTRTITEKRTVKQVEAQMRQLELAILDYKTKLGFYPPDNGNTANANWTAFPPLFYELTGSVAINGTDYQSVFGNDILSGTTLSGFFGRGGVANSADESRKNFFSSMLPFHVREVQTASGRAKLLVVSAKGPEIFSLAEDKTANPWRYNSSNPTNNPGTFDLWAELTFPGKTVVIGNWKRRQK